MRKLFLGLLFLVLVPAGASALERKVYLKRPAVRGEFSKSEAESIGAAFQSKLTLLFLQGSGFSLVNDDDLTSLIEEAEMKAAVDCDASECLLAVADMVGAGYLVRTTITATGRGKARIDSQFSERTQTNELRVIGAAEVSECDPLDTDQVNWYSRQIAAKLLSMDYQIKPFLAETVKVRFELGKADTIQLKNLSIPIQTVTAALPEVRVDMSGDAAKQVSSILKQAISEADVLAGDLKLQEAEDSYRKILEKVSRYKEAYPEMREFEGILDRRIGELRRLAVEKRIADADRIPIVQQQLDAYRGAKRSCNVVEAGYSSFVAPYAAVLEARISETHRKAVKEELDRGDQHLRSGDPRDAASAYQAADQYIGMNGNEMENGGRDMMPYIEQRVLLAYQTMAAVAIGEAEKHYMNYEFAEAEDAFDAAIASAKRCPLYDDLARRPQSQRTADQSGFLDLVQAAEDGAKKARDTALNIFSNQGRGVQG